MSVCQLVGLSVRHNYWMDFHGISTEIHHHEVDIWFNLSSTLVYYQMHAKPLSLSCTLSSLLIRKC